jgi:hypothetical protein
VDERPTVRSQVALTYRTILGRGRLLPIVTTMVLTSVLLQALLEFGPLWMVALAAPAILFGRSGRADGHGGRGDRRPGRVGVAVRRRRHVPVGTAARQLRGFDLAFCRPTSSTKPTSRSAAARRP